MAKKRKKTKRERKKEWREAYAATTPDALITRVSEEGRFLIVIEGKDISIEHFFLGYLQDEGFHLLPPALFVLIDAWRSVDWNEIHEKRKRVDLPIPGRFQHWCDPPFVGCEMRFVKEDAELRIKIQPVPDESTYLDRRKVPQNAPVWEDLISDLDEEGYRVVSLADEEGNVHTHRVGELIVEAFNGTRPPGHRLNYKDGDITNDNPENLEWVPEKVH